MNYKPGQRGTSFSFFTSSHLIQYTIQLSGINFLNAIEINARHFSF
jgi:hypothetical protein